MSEPFANLTPAQLARLRWAEAQEAVDLHCHCLPGLDDGPRSLAASVELCRALVDDGFTTVVATPHQLGRYDGGNHPETVRDAVRELQQALNAQRVPLVVRPGADVRVDERLPRLLDEDRVLCLGDSGGPMLLELPHDVWVEPGDLVADLHARGHGAILSHPERHPHVQRRPELAGRWADAGALLQVTAGSLCGDFGAVPAATAWALVDRGLIALVATDSHDPKRRPPRMTAAIAELRRRVGVGAARRLCVQTPAALLRSQGVAAPIAARSREVEA